MISKEKLKWMKEVGMKEFDRPVKYYLGTNHVYSEEYIKNTPLEKLKERYDKNLIRTCEKRLYDDEEVRKGKDS